MDEADLDGRTEGPAKGRERTGIASDAPASHVRKYPQQLSSAAGFDSAATARRRKPEPATDTAMADGAMAVIGATGLEEAAAWADFVATLGTVTQVAGLAVVLSTALSCLNVRSVSLRRLLCRLRHMHSLVSLLALPL